MERSDLQINQRDSEGRRHCVWESYWGNGTLSCRVHYHHGTLHGVCEDYRTDGNLWRISHYRHGVRRGLVKKWDVWSRVTKEYDLIIR